MSMSSHQKYLDVSTMLRIGCSLIDCNQIQRRRSSCGARPCSRRQHRLLTATLTVGLTTVSPVSLVRDPVIFVDSDLMVALMCVARCRAASQHCAWTSRFISTCTASTSKHPPSRLDDRLPSSSSSLPWFCVDSTYGNGTLVGLPAYLVHRVQSVQNAAARLAFRLRRSDHITDALVSLHWLRVSARIIFKIAVQTYRAIHGDAPQYLRQFTPIADIPSRQRLRSSSSDDLLVPAVRLPTIGRRAFFVAGARTQNDLPVDVTSVPSLLTFRKRLKLHLFRLS